MQLEVNSVVTGKVTGIQKYGAFVQLENGRNGMVHVSEIASSYVKEIGDYLSVGDEVKVRILSIAPDGKISLSIRQADENNVKASAHKTPVRSASRTHQGGSVQQGASFDEMLSRFMQTSDEKMSDLRRSTGERRVSRKSSGGRL